MDIQERISLREISGVHQTGYHCNTYDLLTVFGVNLFDFHKGLLKLEVNDRRKKNHSDLTASRLKSF